MSRLTIAVAALLFTAAALAQRSAPQIITYWTPDAALIAKLEAKLVMPDFPDVHSYALAEYDRYYTGEIINGRKQIIGKLIVPPNREDHPVTGVHVTDLQYMPRLSGGGGCAVVTVTWYIDTERPFSGCNGLRDGGAPVSEQPHWQPDEQLAARMETAIRDYLRRAYRGRDLDQYSRYYWGVTVDGRQVVRGRIITGHDGRHLAGEDDAPLMLDGGCNNIQSRYDAQSGKLTQLSCDGQGGMQPEVPLP